jgi:phenylacetic acid degradation operon negative regulatory protein
MPSRRNASRQSGAARDPVGRHDPLRHDPLRHDPLLRPLSPRSVIASLLLGIHPPRLRGALLVRWCGLLGIAEGTTRVALSRMVDAGELTTEAGRYELAGSLRVRQAGQDWSLAPLLLPWSGAWDLWVLRPGGRDAASRAALRRAAAAARLVERRDGVWGRPGNLPPEATPADALAVLVAQAERWSALPDPTETIDVATEFSLPDSAERARRLLDHLAPVTAGLASGDLDQLAPAFALGAAALQQVRRDPLLPPELAGPGWPGPALRAAYVEYQDAFATAAGSWFAAVRSDPAGGG